MCKVLFIGAHPDDIEIGAAGMVASCCKAKYDVRAMILTDESDDQIKQKRRNETLKALIRLGMNKENIHFTGFKDTTLRNIKTGMAIKKIRSLAEKEDFLKPDIIVTHTNRDAHTDHTSTHEIALGAFRGALFLFYSIHLSSMSDFEPNYFIHLGSELAKQKESALACHASQKDRIEKQSLVKYEKKWAKESSSGIERAEAFELKWQNDNLANIKAILKLSNNQFHKLWLPILDNHERIYLIHSSKQFNGKMHHSSHEDEVNGHEILYEAFDNHFVKKRLIVKSSHNAQAVELFQKFPVILVGGSVSNKITNSFYNHFTATTWMIDYTIPKNDHAFLLNCLTRKTYSPQTSTEGSLIHDYGVISFMRNPCSLAPLVHVAGCTGVSTEAGLKMLADPLHSTLLKNFIWDGSSCTEFPFKYNFQAGTVELISERKRSVKTNICDKP